MRSRLAWSMRNSIRGALLRVGSVAATRTCRVWPPRCFRPSRLRPAAPAAFCYRLESMRQARVRLHRLTGQNFGYDLAGWHEFLVHSPDDYGYRHPYARKRATATIERLINDRDRHHLVACLEKRGETTEAAVSKLIRESDAEARQRGLEMARKRWENVTDRACTRCGALCPEYRLSCIVCGFEMGGETGTTNRA